MRGGPNGIPIELPVDVVKSYGIGTTLDEATFDLLQNYFEGRIINLLEDETDAICQTESELRELQFKYVDGSDVIHLRYAFQAIQDHQNRLIKLIKESNGTN